MAFNNKVQYKPIHHKLATNNISLSSYVLSCNLGSVMRKILYRGMVMNGQVQDTPANKFYESQTRQSVDDMI